MFAYNTQTRISGIKPERFQLATTRAKSAKKASSKEEPGGRRSAAMPQTLSSG
jgi:hypothetical protein